MKVKPGVRARPRRITRSWVIEILTFLTVRRSSRLQVCYSDCLVDEPVVSIVTPSFNHARFIRATIESVLSQNYPHIEYIVMDGGSRDETASIARDYASRLTFIAEPDRGQSHAINKGFKRVSGSILFWLNSD